MTSPAPSDATSSRPHASVQDNTTWHLVRDIEVIRVLLGIDRMVLFGGSWGATLALVYAITHPEQVRHLVLRGVFLSTQAELDWFYGGGVGAFFPDLWLRFVAPLAGADRANPIAAYQRLLFCGDLNEEIRAARAWSAWENALASVHSNGQWGEGPAEHSRAFATGKPLFPEPGLLARRRLDPEEPRRDRGDRGHHRSGAL